MTTKPRTGLLPAATLHRRPCRHRRQGSRAAGDRFRRLAFHDDLPGGESDLFRRSGPSGAIDEGNAMGLTTEGYDLINFGSSQAGGETQIVVGGGFRSQLMTSLSLGLTYEKSVTSPHGLFDDRLTADISFRF